MNLDSPFVRSLDQQVLRRHPPLTKYLDRLGDTRLLELPGPRSGGRVFGKAEWENPNGTVKDRVAFAMVYRLLLSTPPEQRRRVLEYSGGSLSNALAGQCADLDLPLTVVMPASTDPGVVGTLRGRGVEVVLTPAAEAFWGVIERARMLAAAHTDWAFLFQHRNPANLWIHRETTGREVVAQLPPECRDGPCAWVASVGTGGTLVGVYQALRAAIPKVQLYVNSPAELPYGTEDPPNARDRFLGSGGFGLGRRQPFVSPLECEVAGHLQVSYDEVLQAVRRLHNQTGLWVGSSGAANWAAACRVAERLGPDATVLTVLPCATPEFERKLLAAG